MTRQQSSRAYVALALVPLAAGCLRGGFDLRRATPVRVVVADGAATTRELAVPVEVSGGSRDAVRLVRSCDAGLTELGELGYDPDGTTFVCELPPGEGRKEIWVWLLDQAGLRQGPFVGSIALDQTPPPPPTLQLTDPTTGSPAVTRGLTVNVLVGAVDAAVVGFWLAEGGETSPAPTLVDPGWTTSARATLTFAAAPDGPRRAWLVVRDGAGNTAAATAVITVDTTPPNTPTLVLSDPLSGRTDLTRGASVDVAIAAPADATAFLLAEGQTTSPPLGDLRWTGAAPTSFALSAGSGQKTVYLWIRDAAGNLNSGAPPVSASIVRGADVVHLGYTADGCPGAPLSLCDVVASAALPLSAAIQLAPADGVIALHPRTDGEPMVLVDHPEVDRAVTIESVGADPEQVVVEFGDTDHAGLFHLLADGVTLRNFTLRGLAGVQSAINAHLSTVDDDGLGWSGGHLFERLRLEAASVSYSGANSTQAAIVAGDDTVIRACFVSGWWEDFVAAPSRVGLRVIGNTYRPTEQAGGTSGAINLFGASDAVITGNIFYVVNPTLPAAIWGDASTINVTIGANLYVRFDTAGTGLAVAGPSLMVSDDPPVFVRLDRPDLALGSPALDAGGAPADAGALDYYGRPRVAGAAMDLGAVEGATAAALGSTLRVGPGPQGCAGPCDFDVVTQLQPLHEALAAARPGGAVWLYGGSGGPLTLWADREVVIDRPLSLSLAPGFSVGDVIIADRARNLNHGLLILSHGDGVSLTGIAFLLDDAGDYAVWVDPGYFEQPTSPAAALDTIIDRCVFEEPSPDAPHDGAVLLGHGTRVSNSLAVGPFESFAESIGIVGPTLVNNTFYSRYQASTCEGITLGSTQDATIVNNLIDLSGCTNATRTALYGAGPGALTANNLFWGHTQLSNAGYPVDGTNLTAQAPGFTAVFDDLSLGPTSPARDAGLNAQAVGALDLAGAPRIANGTVDLGAFEGP